MTDFGTFSERSTGAAQTYEAYIQADPFRRGLHYPAVQSELGKLRTFLFWSKRILDSGTGDGQLPRLLASNGASVVGYDHNPKMIQQALNHQDTPKLDVKFVEAKPQTFRDDRRFDAATSVMVLNYAVDLDDLTAFFRCAHNNLRRGARFISVVLNPSFAAFDANFFIRRITKLDGDLVRMEFLNEESGHVEQQAVMHQFTIDEYERAATSGGMRPKGWKKLFASPEALNAKGERFWQPCHELQPYALFVARK